MTLARRPVAAPLVAVLAGGAGRRIGGDKPARRLGGMTLLERALTAAYAWSDAVVVVAPAPERLGFRAAEFLRDAAGVEGPLAGLLAGLRRAAETGRDVLTIPVDMPFLPPDLAERLGAALGEEAGPCVAAAESRGRLHPVCARWRGPVEPLLLEEAAAGRTSLRNLAARAGLRAVSWSGEPDPFFNINTVADLEQASTA